MIKDTSIPSTAFLADFMATNNKGMITGKLNTGINKLPLPDFAAIDDNNVKVDEKPTEPNEIIMIKKGTLLTGKPKNIP